METNPIPAPAASAQEQITDTTFKSPLAAPGRLYNVEEADHIVRHLTTEGLFDPEYILLFGRLAGGTQHSEAMCYDLLIVVRDMPDYEWWQARRNLRYKVPFRWREIPYVNPYVVTLHYVASHPTPFIYYAHRDGVLLYSKPAFRLHRPKRCLDFSTYYYEASSYCDTFMALADSMLDAVQAVTPKSASQIRWASHLTAQAAFMYYRVLYYVYHNEVFASDDIATMHERMRTLSTELMLLFDDTHVEHNMTLSVLNRFAAKALTDPAFALPEEAFDEHVGRVVRMGGIVGRCCRRRLDQYKSACDEFRTQHGQ